MGKMFKTHRRLRRLIYNQNIFAYDVLFPDGFSWGGLAEGDAFEVLNPYGVWVQTRLMFNGGMACLQGFAGYGIPLGVFVRI